MVINLKNMNLLFIEDDIECTEISITLLQKFVSKIFHATNSRDALELLKSNTIDFIICDVYLDHNDNGLDFINYLREHNINLPIIVISGHAETQYLFRAIRLNLIAYLIKPIKYDSLVESLHLCSKRLNTNKTTIANAPMNRIFLKDNWFYDISTKSLINEDVIYKLNYKEVLFIDMILKNSNSIISKEMFYIYVWEYEDMSDAALRNFILRIRKRFGKGFLEAVNKIGYKFSFYYCIGILPYMQRFLYHS